MFERKWKWKWLCATTEGKTKRVLVFLVCFAGFAGSGVLNRIIVVCTENGLLASVYKGEEKKKSHLVILLSDLKVS